MIETHHQWSLVIGSQYVKNHLSPYRGNRLRAFQFNVTAVIPKSCGGNPAAQISLNVDPGSHSHMTHAGNVLGWTACMIF